MENKGVERGGRKLAKCWKKNTESNAQNPEKKNDELTPEKVHNR